MTNIDQIDNLVSIFKQNNCELMLMHTVSTPSLDEELNLKTIQTLMEKYSLPIGYSGQKVSVSPSVIAASLGAKAIERHITLDRAMYEVINRFVTVRWIKTTYFYFKKVTKYCWRWRRRKFLKKNMKLQGN